MSETKKELGQHWLQDDVILQSIVGSAEITADDMVLEIGPGLGTLTEKLVATGARVLCLEFDTDLIGGLKKKFSTKTNVEIVHGDIRRFNFSELPAGYKVVANIPYYLTSHLIRSLSETPNPPDRAVLLIQKEVAQRLCARPGNMSILSLTAQFYFVCSLDIEVSARYFTPPPKVDSQVIVLKRRESNLYDVDEKDFFRLIKAGFSEKRKTLRNSLSGGLCISTQQSEQVLIVSGIDPGKRAQVLSFDEWFRLYKNFNM
jgi:16S rRNA (adenine1518-N6/adenine1519-N6)-dimethyltransferase